MNGGGRLRRLRQEDAERRPLALGALDRDLAGVRLDERRDDREPEAGSVARPLPRGLGPEEAAERRFLLVSAHPDPGVADLDQRAVAARPEADDRTAARRELGGVREQVADDLSEPVNVPA